MKIDIKKVMEAKALVESLNGVMFCDICGETNPRHGFYPLIHGPSVSGVTCNKCYLTDEKYLEIFGESKQ